MEGEKGQFEDICVESCSLTTTTQPLIQLFPVSIFCRKKPRRGVHTPPHFFAYMTAQSRHFIHTSFLSVTM